MAAVKPDEAAGPGSASLGRIGERLAEGRWLIAGTAVLLLGLYLGGALSLLVGAVVLAAVVILTAAAPRLHADERLALRAEPSPNIWPETGIKLFADALHDPCFILDRRGIVRYANDRATATFSIRASEALAFKLRVPDLTAAFDRVAKGGGPERIEFAERVPTERWFAAWFANLGGTADRPANFIALVIEDLTEHRRSERIRVDFVANASHELRTPLASLAGFIETLQGSAREDPVARERFLGIMHDQATRMSRLINDLLSLSRIEMRAHIRPSDPIDLPVVIRHVADALEPLAREFGVVVETDLPSLPVVVPGDRDELTQVFENLIENACKYGQAGGRVLVTVKPATGGSGPAATIRDFGPGIAEEHLPRLTERFYRIDLEASRQHRGTGLGLAIVKHIIARHRARLQIESVLGQGASFTVVFPQAANPGSAGAANISERYQ